MNSSQISITHENKALVVLALSFFTALTLSACSSELSQDENPTDGSQRTSEPETNPFPPANKLPSRSPNSPKFPTPFVGPLPRNYGPIDPKYRNSVFRFLKTSEPILSGAEIQLGSFEAVDQNTRDPKFEFIALMPLCKIDSVRIEGLKVFGTPSISGVDSYACMFDLKSTDYSVYSFLSSKFTISVVTQKAIERSESKANKSFTQLGYSLDTMGRSIDKDLNMVAGRCLFASKKPEFQPRHFGIGRDHFQELEMTPGNKHQGAITLATDLGLTNSSFMQKTSNETMSKSYLEHLGYFSKESARVYRNFNRSVAGTLTADTGSFQLTNKAFCKDSVVTSMSVVKDWEVVFVVRFFEGYLPEAAFSGVTNKFYDTNLIDISNFRGRVQVGLVTITRGFEDKVANQIVADSDCSLKNLKSCQKDFEELSLHFKNSVKPPKGSTFQDFKDAGYGLGQAIGSATKNFVKD